MRNHNFGYIKFSGMNIQSKKKKKKKISYRNCRKFILSKYIHILIAVDIHLSKAAS